MKFQRPQPSLALRRSIARCRIVFSLLLLLPLLSYAQVKHPNPALSDLPSGFSPGIISYFAGNGQDQGITYADGSVPTQINLVPSAVAADSLGNVYIANGNPTSSIYVVYAGGPVPATLANVATAPQKGRVYQITGLQGPCSSGTCGEGKPLNLASFKGIAALVFDSANNLYVADEVTEVIRRVDAGTSIVTTVAGQLNSSGAGGDGGPATSANLSEPQDIKLDSFGNIYIQDQIQSALRVVYAGTAPPPVLAAVGITGSAARPGTINTIAGAALQYCSNQPTPGSSGSPGGCGDYGPASGGSALFDDLNSLAVDSGGNIYLADAYASPAASYIRMLYVGGPAPALLSLALGGASPTPGYIYAVTGFAPSVQFAPCTLTPCGDGGTAAAMEFGLYSNTTGALLNLKLDSLGNLYISDASDWAVRKIDTSGFASTVAGIDDPNQTSPSPAPAPGGGPATAAILSNDLYAIAFDPGDNLYISDLGDSLVWQVQPQSGQTISFPAFSPSTVTYGVAPITLSATASSGLPVTFTLTSGPGTINGSQLVVAGAGTIVVTATQPGNSQNGPATPVSQTLTVDQAQLTVTANNATKFFGAPNPTFTATFTGFVNGDTASSPGGVTGTPAFSTTATASSPDGTYPITVEIGSLASTNYAFTDFVSGTLTIGGSTPQTITFGPLAPITYGQVRTESLTATASSGLPVTLQVVSGPGSLNGTTLAITGGGTIVIIATQAGAGSYEAAPSVTQSLVVNPAQLVVTGPTVTLNYGTPVNPNTFPAPAISGFVGSDTAATVLTGSVTYTTETGTPNSGTYPIVVGLGTLAIAPVASANYVLAAPVNGSLIIKPGAGAQNAKPGYIYYFAGDGPALSGTFGDGALPTAVPISNPTAIAADSQGNVFFATDATIYVVYAGRGVPASLANIAAMPQSGRIYQIAGMAGICGAIADQTCGEGLTLSLAAFGKVAGLAFDAADDLYVSDNVSSVLRRVDATTSIVTTVAGQLNRPSSSPAIGDGGPAASASLSGPTDIKVDSLGNLYIRDQGGSVARVIYAAGATAPPPVLAAESMAAQPGTINTIAGHVQHFCATAPTAGSSVAPGACGDNGPAAAGSDLLLGLDSLTVDAAGNVYLADAHSGSIPSAAYLRVIYAGGAVPLALGPALNGVAPVAGDIYALTGYSASFALCAAAPCGDGGLAGSMQFGASVNGLFMTQDALGNLVIADSGDLAVRRIDSAGVASTLAGIDDPNQAPPASPPSAQANPANTTPLSRFLYAVAFDGQGNLYIADSADDLVWQVAPLTEQFISFPAFSPATVSYGVSPIALSATASSSLPVSYAVTSGPGFISGSQLTVKGAGAITVAASQAGNNQYAEAPPVTQSLIVVPVPLTVTANNASRNYGAANPAFTATFTGFVNNDAQNPAAVYSGQPAFSTPATSASPDGSYPIAVSQGTLTSTDYSFGTFVPGTLTVNGYQQQTISFAPIAPVAYGHSPLTLTATASSGLPVTFQVVSGPGTLAANGTTLTIAGGGTIVVTATQTGGGAYFAATPVTQSLVVNPATLSIAGPIVTQAYGTAIVPGSFPAPSISGFVGSDSQATVISGTVQYTTVTGTPNVGSYPITVAPGSLTVVPAETANYILSTPANGSLVIQPAAQAINLSPVVTAQTYGALVPITGVATSGLPVTFTVTGPGFFAPGNASTTTFTTAPPNNDIATVQFTGVGNVTVTATQAGTGNYQAAQPVVTALNVGKAPLDITAYNQIVEQGAPLPTFTYQIGQSAVDVSGGFQYNDTDIPSVVSGIPVFTTTATPSSPAGTYQIVPSIGTLAAPNYYFVFLPGTLTITPPGGFTITASPSSLTIASGLSAQSTLTITPLNVYQGTVTLSCGPVPANVTCVISPATYTFPGSQTVDGTENNAQGTLTISASGAPVVGANRYAGRASMASILLIPGALAGLMLAFSRKRNARKSGIWGALILLVLTAGMFSITSCGGSSKPLTAAPGTSTVMIMGSGTSVSGNGTVTSSTVLTVTVQ